MNKHSLSVIIGRFQPIHQGHLDQLIIPAIEQSDRVLIILGSCFSTRTIKNPFTNEERMQMIMHALQAKSYDTSNLIFQFARDFPYDNNKWKAQILKFVHEFETDDSKIALFGMEKDFSSFYLNFFPLWEIVEPSEHYKLSSTFIRETLFSLRTPPLANDFLIKESLFLKGTPEINLQYLIVFQLIL